MSTDFSGVSAGQTRNEPLQLPAAVLWDMDGTLVDTEPFWISGEMGLVAEYGGEWTHEDSLSLVGSGLIEAARYIKTRANVPLTPEQIVERLAGNVIAELSKNVPWQPGVLELLRQFRELGIPQALVTMSYKEIAAPVIAGAGVFDVVVTGDLGLPPKPDPAPYARACELLGVEPGRAIAIEDSPTGARSANAAGCFVIGVPHAVRVPEATHRHVVQSLAGVTAQQMARWASL